MYVLLAHVEIPKMMLILKDKIYYDDFKDAFYRLHARNHANAMEQTKFLLTYIRCNVSNVCFLGFAIYDKPGY